MAQMAEAIPEVERRSQIQAQKNAVKAAQEAARLLLLLHAKLHMIFGNWKIKKHLQKSESLSWDVLEMDVVAF